MDRTAYFTQLGDLSTKPVRCAPQFGELLLNIVALTFRLFDLLAEIAVGRY